MRRRNGILFEDTATLASHVLLRLCHLLARSRQLDLVELLQATHVDDLLALGAVPRPSSIAIVNGEQVFILVRRLVYLGIDG